MSYREFLKQAEEQNCDTLGVSVNCKNCQTLIALIEKLEEQRDHYRSVVNKHDLDDCFFDQDAAELDAIVRGEG